MTPPEAPQPHRSPADRLAAIVLTVLGVLAGLVSLFVAPFFAMTPTVCGPGECRGSTVVWASVVSWAGGGPGRGARGGRNGVGGPPKDGHVGLAGVGTGPGGRNLRHRGAGGQFGRSGRLTETLRRKPPTSVGG